MFQRILIANRGEVAARIAATARKLNIHVVCVASEADKDQRWLQEVDEVVVVGPAKSASSYLDQEAILAVAKQYRCSAIHPGWGFLAENADFAAKCHAAGITFIGPSPAHIRNFGDKAQARSTMAKLGMPIIPGSKEPVPDIQSALRMAEEVGYPILLKAVAGGGGRGMRGVNSPEELPQAFNSATAEALSSFSDGRLYLERRIVNGRHIEVQIVADKYGNCVTLGERECSLQRRHQKVLEEAPSPGLTEEERTRVLPLVADVVARSGYYNAGTVEMLLSEDGRLYFMEMNTRLQVEHCVSEQVTGVDIVHWQLLVAAGHRLPTRPIQTSGHAIEMRINAEDPFDGFRPCPGLVTELILPQQEGIRVDTHLRAGDRIPPNYDSMIAKIISTGSNRDEAIERALAALDELKVVGVKTNIELHRQILQWEDFVNGTYHTTSLENVLLVQLLGEK